MDDLLAEFLTETSESLDLVDTELVKFEANPSDAATLNNIFRLVHTIKGTCGFLGLPRLAAIAHAGETLLGRYRDGALKVTPAAVTLVLRSIDRIKELLAHLEREGAEPAGEDEDLISALNAISEGGGETPLPTPGPVPEPVDAPPPPEAAGEGVYDPALGRNLRVGEVSMAELEAAFQAAEVGGDLHPSAPAPMPAPAAEDPDALRGEIGVGQSIRVNLDVLETMMTMVSELVLTRNQLLQMVRVLDESEFKAPLQRLSAITAELQESVMKTRMQPVGAAWKKLPRLIRDISNDVGKKINLVMEGEATELDRQVLELIKDPLTHMVRNSADHGLESAAERKRAGKPEAGTIRLSAYHEGGCIVIRIADDGRGLDTRRIREKAIANGLVTADEAAGMTDAQIHRFIFAAGFSTAEKVTSISGRGVGMDVVRTNIEQIGGQVDLSSVENKGSTFTIKIPLTLAIVSTMIVQSGGQRFAIPQLNVKELVRTGPLAEHRVQIVNESPVLRLRDGLLPLVSLATHLQLDLPKPTEANFVVVMDVGGRRFGVGVDNVFDTEEIVVKPLASMLKAVPAFSGATILGDGSVVLIIDPNNLAQAVGELGGERTAGAETSVAQTKEKTSVLVFRAGGETPKAVPLTLVTRLEEIPAGAIEFSAGRAMVQYRDRLLPLVHGAQGEFRTEGMQPVLVFTDAERVMGLAVDEIVDIVDEQFNVELCTPRPGVLGSAVLKGRATDVVDVAHYLTEAFGDWFDREGNVARSNRRRVLLVDDNAFFRNMIAPLISAAGYDVTPVSSAEEAWRLHGEGANFDVIVSDIEMPDEDGFVFARKLSEDGRWAVAPRIALTGLPVAQTAARAPAGAFAQVIRKSDREGLLKVLGEVLQTEMAA